MCPACVTIFSFAYIVERQRPLDCQDGLVNWWDNIFIFKKWDNHDYLGHPTISLKGKM